MVEARINAYMDFLDHEKEKRLKGLSPMHRKVIYCCDNEDCPNVIYQFEPYHEIDGRIFCPSCARQYCRDLFFNSEKEAE